MARVTVAARDLKAGDFLIGSRRRVEYVSRGVRTPSGKIEVKLEGEAGIRTWGASTTITIERES